MDEVGSVWKLLHAARKEYRMRKSKLLSLWTLSSDDSRVTGLEFHPERRTEGSQSKDLLWIFAFALTIALVACGDDSGTSANDDNVSSSSVIQSGDSHEGAGNSKKADPGTSTGSVTLESGMTSSSQKIASSSSNKALSSSWSSEGTIGSSNSKLSSSSSKGIATNSSSSSNDNQVECREQPSTDAHDRDAESCATHNDNQESSSSAKSAMTESSSSEYVPYNHEVCLAGNWNISTDAYKTFIDPRNGRSYYYYTAVSSKTGKSVTVMAENLNIGDMVLGENDQNDDSKIERYCYNNDTTYCDEFGGLYQWAEMMQLPSRCNTESCADLIQPDHQGICPDGWRLFSWDDYVIIRQYNDEFDHGVEGLRSQCFNGYNTSGFSLVGAGIRTAEGKFESLSELAAWFRPEEYESDAAIRAHHGMISSFNSSSPSQNHRELKVKGFSVRCVKLE